MRLIDLQFMDTPFWGSRQMARWLRRQGYKVGRKRTGRLLRGLRFNRPNQVWCFDITYIPMRRGFLYLVVIMDWSTRAVLSWRLSNTMDSDFCVQALEEALDRYGKTEIFNTDQGSQFTSHVFTGVLEKAGVKISMGKGRCLDNVFIKRLWRSLKYEKVYLMEFETGLEARREIGNWIRFYYQERPHSSHDDDKTHMELCNETMAA